MLFHVPEHKDTPISVQSVAALDSFPLCISMHHKECRSCLLLHMKDHNTCHCSSATVLFLEAGLSLFPLPIYSTGHNITCSLNPWLMDPRENPHSKLSFIKRTTHDISLIPVKAKCWMPESIHLHILYNTRTKFCTGAGSCLTRQRDNEALLCHAKQGAVHCIRHLAS